jgi:hypothetical protein
LKPLNSKLKFHKAFEFKNSTNKISMKSISNEKMENSRYSIMSKMTTEKSKSAHTTFSKEAKSEIYDTRKPNEKKKKHSFYVNQQFPNTNLFIMISSINMLFNLPSVVSILVFFNPFNSNKKFGDVEKWSSEDPNIFLYLIITEVSMIAKHSLAIFFFTFSSVFRSHLRDVAKRCGHYILIK